MFKRNRIYTVIMKIGKIIKKYRVDNNFTQSQLAEYSGINEKYYGRIERDESTPTVSMLHQICNALGIRMSDFFITYEQLEK